jgi:hypothetical protein
MTNTIVIHSKVSKLTREQLEGISQENPKTGKKLGADEKNSCLFKRVSSETLFLKMRRIRKLNYLTRVCSGRTNHVGQTWTCHLISMMKPKQNKLSLATTKTFVEPSKGLKINHIPSLDHCSYMFNKVIR